MARRPLPDYSAACALRLLVLVPALALAPSRVDDWARRDALRALSSAGLATVAVPAAAATVDAAPAVKALRSSDERAEFAASTAREMKARRQRSAEEEYQAGKQAAQQAASRMSRKELIAAARSGLHIVVDGHVGVILVPRRHPLLMRLCFRPPSTFTVAFEHKTVRHRGSDCVN